MNNSIPLDLDVCIFSHMNVISFCTCVASGGTIGAQA